VAIYENRKLIMLKASLSLVTVLAGLSLAHPAFAQSDDEPSQKWSYVRAAKAEGVAFVGARFYL
jgi:hypothetical protein